MDLSNAFEDGKACLEGLEERRKAGKVSEAEETSTMKGLKERFREEYRKVVRLFVPVRFPVVSHETRELVKLPHVQGPTSSRRSAPQRGLIPKSLSPTSEVILVFFATVAYVRPVKMFRLRIGFTAQVPYSPSRVFRVRFGTSRVPGRSWRPASTS